MVDENETRSKKETLKCLLTRQADLSKRRGMASREQSFYQAALTLALVAAPLFFWFFKDQIHQRPLLGLTVLYSLTPAAMLPMARAKLRDLENDLQQIEFQIDLFSFDVTKRETRADELLRLTDMQLRRYYDLNLSENRLIFGLGVACILLGTVILTSTLYVLFQLKGGDDSTTKIATAVLGGVGAFLTNFVAAIYLKMSAAATQNLAAFHSRLVETQQLMLGNLLASRIDDDAKRWDTLAALSLRLVTLKEDRGTAAG